MGLRLLGHNALRQDKFEVAEEYYKQVHETSEKILGPDHPDTADVLFDIADLMSERDSNAANKLFDQARRSTGTFVRRVFSALSENEQAIFLRTQFQPNFTDRFRIPIFIAMTKNVSV